MRKLALAADVSRDTVVRFERGDELRYAEVRFEPLRNGGAVTGVRGSVQDITERTRHAMRTEHELNIRARLLDVVSGPVP